MAGDGRSGDSQPRAPGWYPDPWSATGSGERYFDGKKWGTSEKPLGRHTVVALGPERRARTGRRARRVIGPVLLVALLLVAWKIQPHSSRPKVVRESRTGVDRPPAGFEEAHAPLGTPPAPGARNGKYEVLQTQPGAPTTPVAFDPCRPIHYVVNPAGSPADGFSLLRNAIARVHTATGLRFVYDGTTSEAPSKQRVAYQPARYGKQRWAPVLIAWSDENAYPELAGYIAGLGGAHAEYAPDGRLVYTTGQVVFDRRQLSAKSDPNRGLVRAIMLHELGHLVGLDHTSDRREIMYSEAQFNVRDYGPGDLKGLAAMGTQACFPGV